MHVDKSPLARMAYALCLKIEQLPASEESTALSVAASEVLAEAARVTDLLLDLDCNGGSCGMDDARCNSCEVQREALQQRREE